MFISHKSNTIKAIGDTERDCRRNTKRMSLEDYWPWIASITSGDPPVIDYSGEDYTVVECTDEDVEQRLIQLSDYIVHQPMKDSIYNIKYYATKRDSEIEGVKSHFICDDTAKDARLLADKWTAVRRDRDRRLAETDYLALSDQTLSNSMKTYRDSLRDVPEDNSDPDDITWPTKP
jgi:hypothetical protein